MSTPAIICLTIVLLSLCWQSLTFWCRSREYLNWLKRDRAMTQAFHDYIARGDIEEAREIRQAMKREFEKVFD